MVTRRSRLATHTKPAPVAGLILFVAQNDLWCDWTALTLLEKSLEDSRIDLVTPGKPNEDFLVINPQMHLPALTDRELLITGAPVVAEYLDERYPHPRLVPQDPANRAKLRMTMEQFRVDIFPLLQEVLAPKASAKSRAALAELVAASARWFGMRGFFLGNEYTLADLAWAVWFKGVQRAGLKLPAGTAAYREKLGQRKAIATYWKAD